METLRRTFGIAEPVRRGMEMKIAKEGEWRPSVLGGSAGVHGEILMGRDTEIAWEDVYRGMSSCVLALVGGGRVWRLRVWVFIGEIGADVGGWACR